MNRGLIDRNTSRLRLSLKDCVPFYFRSFSNYSIIDLSFREKLWSRYTDLVHCFSKDIGQESQKDVRTPHPKMKMPKVHDSLSWGKRGSKKLSADDSALVSAAMSNMNRFSNDGNFMAMFMSEGEKQGDQSISSNYEARAESSSVDFTSRDNKEDAEMPSMSANQLAAKALQLRLKGKHDEAEKLLVIILFALYLFFLSFFFFGHAFPRTVLVT